MKITQVREGLLYIVFRLILIGLIVGCFALGGWLCDNNPAETRYERYQNEGGA